MAAANSKRPVPAQDLLTLTASKIALEKKAASKASDSESEQAQAQMIERMEMAQNASTSPAAAVGENSFIKLATQMFLDQSYGVDDE